MSLAIVVLHWNDEKQTIRCLRRLEGWSVLKPKIILVNNGSPISLNEDVVGHLNFTIIENEENLGFAGGNNRGIECAMTDSADHILLLNSDAEIAEGAIIKMMEVLEANPDFYSLGPVLVEGSSRHFGGRDMAKHLNTRMVATSKNQGKELHEVDYVPGTIFLAAQKSFRDIGLLDEEYFYSGEIADFCFRIKRYGKRNGILATSEGHHHKKMGNKRLENLSAYYSLRNRFLFIQRNYSHHKRRYDLRWIAIGLRQIIGALAQLNFTRSRAIWLAIRDGMAGKFGNQNRHFNLQ